MPEQLSLFTHPIDKRLMRPLTRRGYRLLLNSIRYLMYRHLSRPDIVTCQACAGTGRTQADPHPSTCYVCKGRGKVELKGYINPNDVESYKLMQAVIQNPLTGLTAPIDPEPTHREAKHFIKSTWRMINNVEKIKKLRPVLCGGGRRNKSRSGNRRHRRKTRV